METITKKGSASIALITGAAAGIGAEFAKVFAAKGYNLILADRDAERQREIAAEIERQYGNGCTVIHCDLSTVDGPEELFWQVEKSSMQVDVVVNNAGILHRGQFSETDLAAHRALIMVNCMAMMTLSHLFLQSMLERGSGRILNVASLSSFQPVSLLANYAASKAYVLSLTEALSMETRGTGVSVTALCPGFVNTAMINREGKNSGMHLPLIRNLEAPDVAREGYAACMAGKPVYINGLGNRLLNLLTKLQPGWLRRWIMIRLSRHGF